MANSATAAAQTRLQPSALSDCLERYSSTRATSAALAKPLAIEDYVIQAVPDASPAKWHLAHTTWFFENFLLAHFFPDYQRFHPRYNYLFNSYYETVGTFFPRPQRGLLSRPTVEEIYAYRSHVDEALMARAADLSNDQIAEFVSRMQLGFNHEEQHQELLITDIKTLYALNPLRPAYNSAHAAHGSEVAPLRWIDIPAGIHAIGHTAPSLFAFDNESPRHRVYLNGAQLASRPVTNLEFMAFMDDAGYKRAELWLSNGWQTVNERGWCAPLYWERVDGEWWHYTLAGMRAVAPHEPVCHVSYYEAEAYARWANARLPTEAEWEVVAADQPIRGNFQESGRFHPAPADAASTRSTQFFGDVWEWTQSAYLPYPGFRASAGSLGEYNGKFMVSQMVLRGGSCATPQAHVRPTYRNFFYAPDRWQFKGLRLARDLE